MDKYDDWKRRVFDKQKKSSEITVLSRDLTKTYWLAKQHVYSKMKARKRLTFATETEMDFPSLGELDFLKSSTLRLRNLYSQLIRCFKELCDNEDEIAEFMINGGFDKNSHSAIMMSQMSHVLKTVQWSRLLIIPVLERIRSVTCEFINHGLSDTEKAFLKMKRLSSHHQAGLMWLNDLSPNLDPDDVYKVEKLKEVQSYIKETKLQLNSIQESASVKLSFATASRNLILTRELNSYFSLLKEHFAKSYKHFKEFQSEFSGLPFYEFNVLAPVLGENNGGDQEITNKYRKKIINIPDDSSSKSLPDNSDPEILDLQINPSEYQEINLIPLPPPIQEEPINELDGIYFDCAENKTNFSDIESNKCINYDIINNFDLKPEIIDENIKSSKVKHEQNQEDKPKSSFFELELDHLLLYSNDPKKLDELSKLKKTKEYQTLNDLATKLDLMDVGQTNSSQLDEDHEKC